MTRYICHSSNTCLFSNAPATAITNIGAQYFGPAEILCVDDHTVKLQFLANGTIRVRNVSHLQPYFFDEDNEDVSRNFTAPKVCHRRFDQAATSADFLKKRLKLLMQPI